MTARGERPDTPCAECEEDFQRQLAADPIARAFAEWADGSVIYVTECEHGTGETE